MQQKREWKISNNFKIITWNKCSLFNRRTVFIKRTNHRRGCAAEGSKRFPARTSVTCFRGNPPTRDRPSWRTRWGWPRFGWTGTRGTSTSGTPKLKRFVGSVLIFLFFFDENFLNKVQCTFFPLEIWFKKVSLVSFF